MIWYKLVFKQIQPIHVGSAKWGVVKETGIFIPGQTMWGALVNVYLIKNKITGREKVKEIEKIFEKITNFFPSFDEKEILAPNYKDENFYLGNYSEEKFRYYFVDTIIQTAITPLSRKAKEESLHELDFILPKPKEKLEDFNKNLYWVGLAYLDDEKSKQFLEKRLKIYIGGDVKYGFGELELISKEKANNEILRKWQIEGNKIKILSNIPSLYFIDLETINEFEGEISLIPEFDFRENTPKVENAKFFISPGSKLKQERYVNISNLRKGKIIRQN